jgi:hypothetical protein
MVEAVGLSAHKVVVNVVLLMRIKHLVDIIVQVQLRTAVTNILDLSKKVFKA